MPPKLYLLFVSTFYLFNKFCFFFIPTFPPCFYCIWSLNGQGQVVFIIAFNILDKYYIHIFLDICINTHNVYRKVFNYKWPIQSQVSAMVLVLILNICKLNNSSIYRNVTSSSAVVGCMATHESKLALVAPILMATANPCSISSQPWPIIWSPNTCDDNNIFVFKCKCVLTIYSKISV